MPSLLAIAGTVLFIYLSSFVYNFARNYANARKSGLPIICVPWVQNHFIWMVICGPSRPYLKKYLPPALYDRMILTIFGFEFWEKLRPYEKFAAPQGNDKSFVMVTPGLYEVNTRDAELAHEILRRPRDFQQHHLLTLFMSKFGHNVLTSDGDVWVRQRKVIASTINEKISKTVFNESIRQTKGLVEEVSADEGKNGGETLQLFDMMKKVTINVLFGAGMGSSVDWEEDLAEKPKEGFKLTYIAAVKVIIDAVAGPIILPKWFLDNYPSSLPGQKFMQSLGQALEEFPTHTKDMLDEERQRMSHGSGESRSTIMSQLLQASEQGAGDKKAMSDDEMMGNLFVFTAAGFDTTANTISYALVLMSRYPEWQDWILEEIDSILPSDPTTELDYTTIYPKATRVMAVMLETLRLFTPLIHIAKQTRTPQTITTSKGTFYFPAKASVYINSIGLHIDPKVWRNLNLANGETKSATDEVDFRPSRWIMPDGSIFKPPPGAFIPWSAGPRVCPGQKMAQVEFTSIFLTLFRKNRVDAAPLSAAETRKEIEERLDARMKDSMSLLTLQMNDIYNMSGDEEKGLKLKVSRRKE